MHLIDLTLPVSGPTGNNSSVRVEERIIAHGTTKYTGMIYHFAHDSMVGTYIDFPGHIKETDDGLDAEHYPIEKLFCVDAAVIRLNREDGSGAVTVAELQAACPCRVNGGALIINALGKLRFDEIESRSVWLDKDAIQWIINTGVHLLVSDIYESKALHGVFYDLFGSGVSTVCCPVNLHMLTAPRVKLTVLMVRFSGVTQLPCRVLAEME